MTPPKSTANDEDNDGCDFFEWDKVENCMNDVLHDNETRGRDQLLNDNANCTMVTDTDGNDGTEDVYGMMDAELNESLAKKALSKKMGHNMFTIKNMWK